MIRLPPRSTRTANTLSLHDALPISQALYEDGAITYMRTDGVQMDGSAISAARKAIATRYDGGYVPDKSRQYQAKAKNAQEAHEAIRPTDFRSEEHTSELQSLMRTRMPSSA